MALLDIRRRSGYLFLAVMIGHVILISAQVNSRSGVPVLESVTFGVFAEAQRGMSTGVSGLRRDLDRGELTLQVVVLRFEIAQADVAAPDLPDAGQAARQGALHF